MDVSQLITGTPTDVEPQVDIVPGEHVRSYDFAGVRTCYAEGVVEAITEPMEGCARYALRVSSRIWEGKEIPVEDPYVYPPVNGTPSTFGGLTNCVERVPG